MKSSFRYVRPKTVQMMKNDKNGLTGSVNCFKMHSIRKAETVHETDSTNAELKRRAANGVLKDGTVLIAERQTRGRGGNKTRLQIREDTELEKLSPLLPEVQAGKFD